MDLRMSQTPYFDSRPCTVQAASILQVAHQEFTDLHHFWAKFAFFLFLATEAI